MGCGRLCKSVSFFIQQRLDFSFVHPPADLSQDFTVALEAFAGENREDHKDGMQGQSFVVHEG